MCRSSFRPRGPALFALLLALALPVRAADVRPFAFDELVDRADEIVVGRVIASSAHWQGALILTVTTIAVDEDLKGRPGGSLRITQLGGTAVHPRTGLAVTLFASHHVALQTGERVLLFVARNPRGLRQLVGAHQGKYVIREEKTRGRDEIPVGPKRLRVLREPEGDRIAAEPVTLDEMRARITRRIAAGEEQR